jgi:hypothetical protein
MRLSRVSSKSLALAGLLSCGVCAVHADLIQISGEFYGNFALNYPTSQPSSTAGTYAFTVDTASFAPTGSGQFFLRDLDSFTASNTQVQLSEVAVIVSSYNGEFAGFWMGTNHGGTAGTASSGTIWVPVGDEDGFGLTAYGRYTGGTAGGTVVLRAEQTNNSWLNLQAPQPDGGSYVTTTISAVPEPATVALGLGSLIFIWALIRKRMCRVQC